MCQAGKWVRSTIPCCDAQLIWVGKKSLILVHVLWSMEAGKSTMGQIWKGNHADGAPMPCAAGPSNVIYSVIGPGFDQNPLISTITAIDFGTQI